MQAIDSCGDSYEERLTVKQLERTKKGLETRLEKLIASDKKDNVVTWEELGVDMVFVDESHYYKNLYIFTKMRNVAGISNTQAQKSTDLYMKSQYIDRQTPRRGNEHATGTPISNSMTELFTLLRYLRPDLLRQTGLTSFDELASVFCETTTTMELKPEGTGYQPKTRIARFNNLPELMTMVRSFMDIQTAEMLKLPVPKLKGGKAQVVVLEPSEEQRMVVQELSERADTVRSGSVDPRRDNMLSITNDGRLLALDQRLFDGALPDNTNSKVNACAERVYEIWRVTIDKRGTQLVFSDLSTPNPDKLNVYDDLKQKLIGYGIPEAEIEFIHNANTDTQKAALFARVRSGDVRVLIGSTPKLGAGTNVQRRLIALHHLDVPYRPSDIEQREGRILRQGNDNEEVEIYRYVTRGTFDLYSWQILENKQRFIAQIMTGETVVRSAEAGREYSPYASITQRRRDGHPQDGSAAAMPYVRGR